VTAVDNERFPDESSEKEEAIRFHEGAGPRNEAQVKTTGEIRALFAKLATTSSPRKA